MGVPDIGDGLGEDRFLSRPSGQGAAAVGIVGKDDVVVAGRLDGEDVDLGEDAPAVGKLAGHDVDIDGAARGSVGEGTVVVGILPIKLAVAGLHVRIDEDPVPVLAGGEGLLPEEPDARLGGLADTAAGRVDLLESLQDPHVLRDRDDRKRVAEDPDVTLVGLLGGDDGGEVADCGDRDRAVFGIEGAPGGAGVVGEAHGLAGEVGKVGDGDVHTGLEGVKDTGLEMDLVACGDGVVCGPVAERELHAGADPGGKVGEDGLCKCGVGGLVELGEDAAEIAEESHMAHFHGLEDFLPGPAGGAEVLPCHVLGGRGIGARPHQDVECGGMGMGDTDRVDHADAGVLVLGNLVGSRGGKAAGPGAFQDVRGPGDGKAVGIDLVGKLGGRLIGSLHDGGLAEAEVVGMFVRIRDALRVVGCPDHNDLRIETHVIVAAEGDGPADRGAEVVVKRTVDDAFHEGGGRLVLGSGRDFGNDIVAAEDGPPVVAVGKPVPDGGRGVLEIVLCKLAVAVVGRLAEDRGGRDHLQGLDGVERIGDAGHEVRNLFGDARLAGEGIGSGCLDCFGDSVCHCVLAPF